ncbi:autoinducer-2 kinase, partial [Salmonella enterica subsp. enterica serovar Infantis]
LWSQILADVTGLTDHVPVVKEATALGCDIAAGVGVGVWPSLADTGEKLVRWDREHTPNPENVAVSQQAREKWQAVYQDQRA